ncbi:FHA domain-containing protein [Planctomicrobium sp. SH664]|uniref:FHA domain-containing protein n=1 Tax=Planctomicrobium sp. SH664 TaxID=3448125 RepID=UPI003F5B215F
MRQAELKVASGKQVGNTIPLPQGRFLIGREEDCNLRPNSELVSRHHCVFNVDEYSVRVRDLGSTNGTLVNGERIRGAVILNQGDVVSIGKIDFQVVIHESAQDTATHIALDSETRMMPAPKAEPTLSESPSSGELELNQPSATDTIQMPVASQILPVAGPAAPPAGDTQFMGQMGMPMQPTLGYPQMGYPQMMPYGYPGYPPMPQQMGYPMPGMYPQMPMPQMPPMMPAPPQAPEPEVPAPVVDNIGLRLPNPEETGAKPPAPKPVETGEKTADAKAKEEAPKRAADIINQYRSRRPTT